MKPTTVIALLGLALVAAAAVQAEEVSAASVEPTWWGRGWCKRTSTGCSASWKVPRDVTRRIKYTWNRKFNCNKRGCFDSCPNTKPYFAPAYTWIAAQPNLSTLEALLDLFATNPAYAPTVNALKGDFGGTIVAPTDPAFAEYTKQMVVPATNPAVQPFLFELVTYHVLGQRLYASELKPGTCYNTLYTGLNGGEAEQLCWGESSKYELACKPKWTKKWGSSYSSAGKKSLEYYFVDEQQNTIPLACVDKWVQGGGVIHTVTKVAQPSDLFPSIAVAATKAGLTTLAAAVTEAGLLNTLETTISIVFAPTNTAFNNLLTALNITLADLIANKELLTTVLRYHVCAFDSLEARAAAVAARKCTTLLGRELTWTPDLVVSYGNGQTTKVLATVKTPLSLVNVIDAVMVPAA